MEKIRGRKEKGEKNVSKGIENREKTRRKTTEKRCKEGK